MRGCIYLYIGMHWWIKERVGWKHDIFLFVVFLHSVYEGHETDDHSPCDLAVVVIVDFVNVLRGFFDIEGNKKLLNLL